MTGGRSPLGRALVAALASSPGVETVRGVEPSRRGSSRDEDALDFVSFVPDHRRFVEYVEKERIDTVVQCGLAPDRSGLGSRSEEADVISTMCLGAAIGQEGSPIRSWVLASSTAVYPIGSHSSLLQHERQQLPREEETLAASIAEAEEYARDVAHRLPHVNVAILRLQQLVGPDLRGPLASLLGQSPVPAPMGFDPAVQLLHLDDAAAALAFAVRRELAGLYNVASKGLIRWQDAIRITGRSQLPVLPMGLELFEPLLERVGVPHVPVELLDLLRFGHAVDIEKIERAGWHPRFDQHACLAELAVD